MRSAKSVALGHEDLVALVDTSRALASELHLGKLFHRILDAATRLSDSPDGCVLLLDDARDALYFADACGEQAAMLLAEWGREGPKRVPLIGSKAGEAYTSMTSIVVEAVAEDPNHFKGVDRATRKPTASMVCVPLVALDRTTAQPRVLGVVQILNKRGGDYTARDRMLLERFAEQAAVAIQNARLVRDLFASKGLYLGDDDPTDPRELLARPAWSEKLSVLGADMRGFTQLCQVVGRPERTQVLLNAFLTMLAEKTLAHAGVVNKFLGDGVLAFFRRGDHARQAVECAFDMLAAFDVLKARWDRESNVELGFLDLGIGISTEDVILGAMGSERVWDFTAIGNGVNLATHLMEHARDGRRLLVDKVTFNQARDAIDAFEGPEDFELRKPGQTVAHPYARYLLVRGAGRMSDDVPAAAKLASAAPRKRGVFISYSRHDGEWRALLRTHLQPYVQSGAIEVWDDTTIEAGADWTVALDRAIEDAAVALFIVSPTLLASRFIQEEEIAPFVRKARAKEVRILWLPVTASSYEETEFRTLQAALNPAKPLDAMSPPQQHHALVDLCKIIKAALA